MGGFVLSLECGRLEAQEYTGRLRILWRVLLGTPSCATFVLWLIDSLIWVVGRSGFSILGLAFLVVAPFSCT